MTFCNVTTVNIFIFLDWFDRKPESNKIKTDFIFIYFSDLSKAHYCSYWKWAIHGCSSEASNQYLKLHLPPVSKILRKIKF